MIINKLSLIKPKRVFGKSLAKVIKYFVLDNICPR